MTPRRRLGLEALFVLLLLPAVAAFGQNTVAMTLFVLVNLAVRWRVLGQPGDGWFLLLGVVAGGGNDLLSMIRGVYAYTPPHLLPWPIPLWMVLFWGHIFLLFRAVLARPALREPEGPPPLSRDRRLQVDLVLLVLFKLAVYRWAGHEWLASVAGLALLGLRLLVNRPTAGEWRLLAATLSLGPLYEIVLVALGLYVYQHGLVFGLPPWLLVFWALAILVAKEVYAHLEETLAGARRAAEA